MSGWEIAAPVLLGILVIAIIVFSVIRPSSAVRFGIFIERKILDHKKDEEPPPSEDDTAIIPPRRDHDSW